MQLFMYYKNPKYPRNALRKHSIFPSKITAYQSFLILCYLTRTTGFNLTKTLYSLPKSYVFNLCKHEEKDLSYL